MSTTRAWAPWSGSGVAERIRCPGAAMRPPDGDVGPAGEAGPENENPARQGAGSGARYCTLNYPAAPNERGELTIIAVAA